MSNKACNTFGKCLTFFINSSCFSKLSTTFWLSKCPIDLRLWPKSFSFGESWWAIDSLSSLLSLISSVKAFLFIFSSFNFFANIQPTFCSRPKWGRTLFSTRFARPSGSWTRWRAVCTKLRTVRIRLFGPFYVEIKLCTFLGFGYFFWIFLSQIKCVNSNANDMCKGEI